MNGPEFYEVAVRESGLDELASWRVLPHVSTDADELEIPGLEPGTSYDVRFRTIAADGSASAWVYRREHKVTARTRDVPGVTDLRPYGDGCLTWRAPDDRANLAGFLVRHVLGASEHWGSMEPAHEGYVREPRLSTCGIPGGLRTFAVVAVDVWGNMSPPAFLVTRLEPLDLSAAVVLHEVDLVQQGFPGEVLGATIGLVGDDVDRFWPVGLGSPLFWERAPDGAFWYADDRAFWPGEYREADGPRFWDTSGAAFWAQRVDRVRYTFSVEVPGDLGGDAVLSIDLAATRPGAVLEYRHDGTLFWSTSDPVFWSSDPAALFWSGGYPEWQPWPGKVAGVGGGSYELRLTLPGEFDTSGADVTALAARVSLPRLEEIVPAFVIPAGGTRVPLSQPFRVLEHVAATPRMRAGSVPATVAPEDVKPVPGPYLVALDATGAPVEVVADVYVRGY